MIPKIKTLYEGEHLLLRQLEEGWEYVQRKGTPDVVIVIAWNKDRLVLLSQFRHSLQKRVMEFPAGIVEEGESIEDAARREFLEETGLTLGTINSIGGPYPTSAGLTNEMVHVVLGEVTTDAIQLQKLDANEDIILMQYGVHYFAGLLTLGPNSLLDVKVRIFIEQYLTKT